MPLETAGSKTSGVPKNYYSGFLTFFAFLPNLDLTAIYFILIDK